MLSTDKLKNREVINIRDGRSLGFICDIEVNLEKGTIEGIVIPTGKRLFSFLTAKEDDLLIIDNMDSGSGTLPDLLKDPVYKQLQQMKLRLLITTRFEYRGAIQINRLDDDDLYRIFLRHEAPVAKQEMDALIRAVSGHTLAIDLIARTLADIAYGDYSAREGVCFAENGNPRAEAFFKVFSRFSYRFGF